MVFSPDFGRQFFEFNVLGIFGALSLRGRAKLFVENLFPLSLGNVLPRFWQHDLVNGEVKVDEVTELNSEAEENQHLEGIFVQLFPSIMREQAQSCWNHHVADYSKSVVELGRNCEPALRPLLPTHKD